MGALLDILCVVLLVVAVVSFAQKGIASALLSLAVLAVTFLGAYLLSFPVGLLAEKLVAPPVETKVANRLADMFSAPHLGSARETAGALDAEKVAALIEENPPAFAELLAHYGAQRQEILEMPVADIPAELPAMIAWRYVRSVAMSVSFGVLFVLLFIAGKLLQRGIEGRMRPAARLYGAKRALPPFIGLAAGLVMVLVLSVPLSWLSPTVGADSVVFSPEALKDAGIYDFLHFFNPIIGG